MKEQNQGVRVRHNVGVGLFKGDLAKNSSSIFRVFSCLNDGYGPG